jgi:hypothetical protein
MTKLIDLLELYRILNQSEDNELLLTDMMEAAQLDDRIDRTVLADTIIAECGSMFPRWNTTTVFKRLGITFFKREAREIEHDLDVLGLTYNPLYEYEEISGEVIDENKGETKTRTDNLESKRTDNLKEVRTPNYSEQITAGAGAQTDHYVSADNEQTAELRTRDVSTIAGQTVSHSGTDTVDNTGTLTTDHTGTQKNETDYERDLYRDTEKHGRKRTGAELVREEILANHFNIYEIIVERFTDQMMMGVY